MTMHFTKMHGCGNDYVYVNGFEQQIEKPESTSIFVSDRHFGIGGDGLVLILPSEQADFRMRMFNADGSEGKMCGNATRCIGKYVYEHGMTNQTHITLETLSGIKYLDLHVENSKVTSVTVDMGKAILTPKEIPMSVDGDCFIAQEVEVDGKSVTITAISMGNPHAITYVDNTDVLDLEKIGPAYEHHSLFPERVNTEFVQLIDRTHIKMRVWERGSGETLACGTGACASVVACVENGYCDHDTEVEVALIGGLLYITYQTDGTVMMRGGATTVFDGTVEL